MNEIEQDKPEISQQPSLWHNLWLQRGIWLVIGLILAMAVKWLVGALYSPIPPSRYADLGGSFTLEGINGPVSLQNYAGKVVVLFFGYTHCPDICPTTLANIAAGLELLDQPGELNKTQVVFITINPDQENAVQTHQYANHFHPNIIGLSGTRDAINAVARQYLAGHKRETADTQQGYTLSHSGYLYLIRPDGYVGSFIRHTSSPEQIATAIREWLPWAKDL